MKDADTRPARRGLPMLAACLAAVPLLAALPAAFLAATDVGRFDHARPAAQSYTAQAPARDDFYLLRQLAARAELPQMERAVEADAAVPGQSFYVAASTYAASMEQSYSMGQYGLTLLQNLADAGVMPDAWVRALDYLKPENDPDYTYYGNFYYSTDSLGFLTITAFVPEQSDPARPVTFTLTMDSKTGAVVNAWLAAGEELPAPGPEALPAWAEAGGLSSLGDWTVPADTGYQNALYSPAGQLLLTAAVHPYTDYFHSDAGGRQQWVLSLQMTPAAPDELARLTGGSL